MSDLFGDVTAILVLHMLSDVQGFLRALMSHGLKPERTVIANIPYSTKEETLAILWASGFRNLRISAEYPIDAEIASAVDVAAEIAQSSDTKLLVIEDGGYVGPYIHRHRPELLSLVKGIVEQTENGIWQYDEDTEAGTPAVDIQVPIVSVATSELKKRLESPLIGDAVHHHVADLIGRTGIAVSQLRTLVLGYGATGSEVARRFRETSPSKPPLVYDQDEAKRLAAQEADFSVPGSMQEACDSAELIIGCTGRDNVLTAPLLLSLHHTSYFANGSFKRKEIHWSALEGLQVTTEMLPHNVGRRVTLSGGHQLMLLADGFPVNFVGESVPDEEIAFVYGLLLYAAALAAKGNLSPGLHDIPGDIQAGIEGDHYRVLDRPVPAKEEPPHE